MGYMRAKRMPPDFRMSAYFWPHALLLSGAMAQKKV